MSNSKKKNLKEFDSNVAHPELSKGEFLKQSREAQGYGLEEIHEATKIPLDALRAIEEGYTVRTLSPFYYKGFLKIYATYLNVDISEVIEDYKKEELPQELPAKEWDGFDFKEWFSKVLTRQRKRQLVILAGIILGLFLLFKMITFLMSYKPEPSAKKVKKVSAPKKIKEKKVKVEPRVQAPVVQAVTPVPSATAQQPEAVRQELTLAATAPVVAPPQETPPSSVIPLKNVVLTLKARSNSWLRIKSDGEIVFQSTLNKDSVETWAADEKIEITGRVDDLEFEVNGDLIGQLGRKDRKARMVEITKDGLAVIK